MTVWYKCGSPTVWLNASVLIIFPLCQSCWYETHQKHKRQRLTSDKGSILDLSVCFITLLRPKLLIQLAGGSQFGFQAGNYCLLFLFFFFLVYGGYGAEAAELMVAVISGLLFTVQFQHINKSTTSLIGAFLLQQAVRQYSTSTNCQATMLSLLIPANSQKFQKKTRIN